MYRLTTTMMIVALSLASQLTHAAPSQDAPSVIVHFTDLDLTHGDGVAVLYRRLKGAAKTVCASLDSRDLAMQMRFKGCVETAIGSAVAKVDRPALTAYYRAQFKGRNATFQIAQN